MSGPVATRTGSSGEAQPLPGLSRLSSHCKSSMLQLNYKYIKFIESILDNQ